MTVCDIILKQLGASTLALLGAYMLMDLKNGLGFRIKGSKKANLIQIKLRGDDTYTMEFWKVRGLQVELVSQLEGVYVNQLHDLIAKETELCTRL